MAMNLASSAKSIPKFWAGIRERALKDWNSDSSRPPWASVKERLTVAPRSPVAAISAREQTAASELARIRENVLSELKRLQKPARELNSLLRKTQRRVRATMKRMGEIVLWKAPNAEDRAMREQVKALKRTAEGLFLGGSGALGIGPNERQLRAILELKPFQFPKVKPAAFPKNDRITVVLALPEILGRPVNLKDLALASLLLGYKPTLASEEQCSYDQVLSVEQDDVRKAVSRAKDHGRLGADAANWLAQGVFVQASPHTPQELANLKE